MGALSSKLACLSTLHLLVDLVWECDEKLFCKVTSHIEFDTKSLKSHAKEANRSPSLAVQQQQHEAPYKKANKEAKKRAKQVANERSFQIQNIDQ